ncbi:OLC1v1011794C1 [Oldenlandia corymbosa var. corymbosa]|uniref:Ribosome-recycling factor, chloroplastic n=1 Tax=Oldenlandia corymbosa var. corymbosa TaxID=529605 RepID=A0AAV1DUI0_OLDCO|nr:OLC1v1011794C1 [Oldenlandia corymbosa var. corymbosa]
MYMDTDDDDEEDFEEDNRGAHTLDIGPTVKSAASSQMEAAIDALSRELLKLRTGRASAGMLDHIIVESVSVKSPLNRMAVVSVIDPKTLSITPFDPNTLKELEKAIVSSPLGLNPRSDGQRLIASIPPLTKEHMQAVCKVVAKSSEDAKQSIRRARQKALDTIKKAVPKKGKDDSKKKGKDKETSDSKKKAKDNKTGPSFSEDDAKRLEKEIDEITKKYIKSAEDMCKAKEKEITAS